MSLTLERPKTLEPTPLSDLQAQITVPREEGLTRFLEVRLENTSRQTFDADEVPSDAAPRPILPVLLPPKQAVAHTRVLKKWEGVVTSLGSESFWAQLIAADDGVEEEAEFSWEDVSEEDLPLVCEGAVFYWSLFYSISTSGQVTRSSMLRFRRLPTWTKRELEQAEKRAEDLESWLLQTPPS